ncbi:MAG TPA: DNA-processing protein DprA [Gemmatimonadales bacterium]|jgi:DNA processing protein
MPEWDSGQREAYLTLALVPGIGFARLGALLERFETPSGVLAAPLAHLAEVPGMSPAAATAIQQADHNTGARAQAELLQLGGRLLLAEDVGFPAALREIPEPPTCLFAQGRIELLELLAVAIVGSRDHSTYGAEACRCLARAAAEAGLAVVSGMARGLDAVAHAGALEAHGATIGVLGNGFGVIYPAANRQLYEQVAEQGLLVTEFPPGERPNAGSFQRRNRLISGLARVTVVVEAAITSGTLQTVACAQEQGRDVLAVPGPITSPVSAGTNRLIRDGAEPLLELSDLLHHYPELARSADGGGADPVVPVAPLERRLLTALHRESLPVERLVALVDAPVADALDALSALELRGVVAQEGGGRYRLSQDRLFR